MYNVGVKSPSIVPWKFHIFRSKYKPKWFAYCIIEVSKPQNGLEKKVISMSFKENSYQQMSFTDIFSRLTAREQKTLENSWAKAFADAT